MIRAARSEVRVLGPVCVPNMYYKSMCCHTGLQLVQQLLYRLGRLCCVLALFPAEVAVAVVVLAKVLVVMVIVHVVVVVWAIIIVVVAVLYHNSLHMASFQCVVRVLAIVRLPRESGTIGR